MRRREFLGILGGAAAMPFAARAQERVRHIGILMNVAENDREGQVRLSAFLEELAKQGWTDGRNVRIAVRWTAGDNARVRQLASEIAALAPDVILVWGAAILRAVHEATTACLWCLCRSLTLYGPDLLQVLPGPADELRVSLNSNTTSAESGCNFSRK